MFFFSQGRHFGMKFRLIDVPTIWVGLIHHWKVFPGLRQKIPTKHWVNCAILLWKRNMKIKIMGRLSNYKLIRLHIEAWTAIVWLFSYTIKRPIKVRACYLQIITVGDERLWMEARLAYVWLFNYIIKSWAVDFQWRKKNCAPIRN